MATVPISTFNVGQSYNLTTINSTILGNNLNNLQLIGIVNYAIAITIKDITNMQKTLLSSLPVGSPTDMTLYDYLVFVNSSGQKMVLALIWLVNATQINTTGIQITVQGIGNSDITNIQNALISMGYTQFSITSL